MNTSENDDNIECKLWRNKREISVNNNEAAGGDMIYNEDYDENIPTTSMDIATQGKENIDDSDEVANGEMNKRRKIVNEEEDISKVEDIVHEEKQCIKCGYNPCVFLQEYDSVVDICEMHETSGKSNKQICFEIYRYMIKVIYD